MKGVFLTEKKKCRRCAKYKICSRTIDGKWICAYCKAHDEEIAKLLMKKLQRKQNEDVNQ